LAELLQDPENYLQRKRRAYQARFKLRLMQIQREQSRGRRILELTVATGSDSAAVLQIMRHYE
jgi:hypothetical protein